MARIAPLKKQLRSKTNWKGILSIAAGVVGFAAANPAALALLAPYIPHAAVALGVADIVLRNITDKPLDDK